MACPNPSWFYAARVDVCHWDYFSSTILLSIAVVSLGSIGCSLVSSTSWAKARTPQAIDATADTTATTATAVATIASAAIDQEDPEEAPLPHVPALDRLRLLEKSLVLLVALWNVLYLVQSSTTSSTISPSSATIGTPSAIGTSSLQTWDQVTALLFSLAWILHFAFFQLQSVLYVRRTQSQGRQDASDRWLAHYRNRNNMWFWSLALGLDGVRFYTAWWVLYAPDAAGLFLFGIELQTYGHCIDPQTSLTPLAQLLFISIRWTFLWLLVFSALWCRRILTRGYTLLGTTVDAPRSAFADFFSKMRKLLPFMWPEGNRGLQLLIAVSVVLLLIGRVTNLLVPMQYKAIVDALSPGQGTPFPIRQLLLFVGLQLLQGSSGVIATLQSTAWIPVEQFTTRKVALKMFDHLHRYSGGGSSLIYLTVTSQ